MPQPSCVERVGLMTQAKDHISLMSILPKLPAEGQSWINELDASNRRATECLLNIVGEESFVKNWRQHRADQQATARGRLQLAKQLRSQRSRMGRFLGRSPRQSRQGDSIKAWLEMLLGAVKADRRTQFGTPPRTSARR